MLEELIFKNIEKLRTDGYVVIDDIFIDKEIIKQSMPLIISATEYYRDTAYPLLGIYKPKGVIRNSGTDLAYSNKPNCKRAIHHTTVMWNDLEHSRLLLFSNKVLNGERFLVQRTRIIDSSLKDMSNLYILSRLSNFYDII